MMTSPICSAISAAGSQKALAQAIGVHQSLISQWATGRLKIPAERVRAVEAATGVSRHALRPDIFGPAPTQPEVRDVA